MMRSFPKAFLLIRALLSLLMAVHVGAAVPSFQVRGTVRSSSFEAGTTNVFTSTFHVRVNGCEILIHSVVQVDQDVAFREYYSAGTNSMIVVRYPSEKGTNGTQIPRWDWNRSKLNAPESPRNEGTVFIRPDALPLYGFEYLTVVWLAYGSHCYYNLQEEQIVPPVVQIAPGFRESGGRVSSHWKINNSPPGFLRFMAELSDGQKNSTSSSALTSESLTAAFPTGYTNAIFSTKTFTNIAG